MVLGRRSCERRKDKAYLKTTRQEMSFEEMKELFKDKPMEVSGYVIGGIWYTVVSHFVGSRDADDILISEAYSKAYADALAPPDQDDEQEEDPSEYSEEDYEDQ